MYEALCTLCDGPGNLECPLCNGSGIATMDEQEEFDTYIQKEEEK